jgi:nicotinamidase-related amidase
VQLHGNTALIVIDIQKSSVDSEAKFGIPHMEGGAERIEKGRRLVGAARAAGVPPIFIQEVHKRTLVDFGRELDGTETVHCLEGDEATELAIDPLPDEYHIPKRRYSAFFGTELEIVLKAYQAQTVFLVGGLTDVCIHYTAVDAHQHDYRVRVLTDCVGGSSQPAHDAALAAMAYLQRDALVTSGDVHQWLAARQASGQAARPE